MAKGLLDAAPHVGFALPICVRWGGGRGSGVCTLQSRAVTLKAHKRSSREHSVGRRPHLSFRSVSRMPLYLFLIEIPTVMKKQNETRRARGPRKPDNRRVLYTSEEAGAGAAVACVRSILSYQLGITLCDVFVRVAVAHCFDPIHSANFHATGHVLAHTCMCPARSAGGGVGEAAAVARWLVRECARGCALLCGPLAWFVVTFSQRPSSDGQDLL